MRRVASVKGIILAAGKGTRLSPITSAVSKQLLPVYDKPMIYYPLSTLMLAGIRELLVITTPRDTAAFRGLLRDGSHLGLSLAYAKQDEPRGLADAFRLGESFLDSAPSALILGDNLFHGPGLGGQLKGLLDPAGAAIFGYRVADPSNYGVVEVGSDGRPCSIVEKPLVPVSNLAVPGLYFYDARVVELAKELRPSERGELEITDINRWYLERDELAFEVLPRGTVWLDTGSYDSLHDASEYVRVVEKRQGFKIGCIEEVAWRNGWIDDNELRKQAEEQISSGYGRYLLELLENP